MMTNLFSMFDPSNFYFNSIWYLMIFLIFTPIFIKSSYSNLLNIFSGFISNEIKNNNSDKMIILNLTNIFIMIILFNLLAMLPFSFTFTAQVNMIFPFSISLWLSINLFFLINKTNSLFTHMLPMGTPSVLMPILILIELTSNLIRPITLSVRLIANLVAGHLLLHLLSSFSFYLQNFFFFTIPFSFILYILEIAVCFIQGYIFTILITLYASEIH